jgi:hypothetical protein
LQVKSLSPERAGMEVGRSQHRVIDQAPRLIAGVVVLLLITAGYSLIYRRQDALPVGIGSNLVPAERMLRGEVVYRDFFMIQTPGILFYNLWLFKFFGTSLLTALQGILIFKVLTVVSAFLLASKVVRWRLAILPAMLSAVWLAPGGPFRPAPIQHEILFALLAALFTLRWLKRRTSIDLLIAGFLVGLVAMFKQNTGLYCCVALLVSVLIEGESLPTKLRLYPGHLLAAAKRKRRGLVAAISGVAVPCAFLIGYLAANHALGAMMRDLLGGPAAHIRMKLTGYPLPVYIWFVAAGTVTGLAAARALALRLPRLSVAIKVAVVVLAFACAALAPAKFAEQALYWFQPLLFLWACWEYKRRGTDGTSKTDRAVLLVLTAFSIAVFLESFPRSVRGLVIGSMPLAFVLLVFLFDQRQTAHQSDVPARDDNRRSLAGMISTSFEDGSLACAVIVAMMLAFALNLIVPRYVDRTGRMTFALRATTEPAFDRARGVLFSKKQATDIEEVVAFIRERVPENGFFFAHALDSTNYYFLAARRSPTRAMLWNDAGTDDPERINTLESLKANDVQLVVTTEAAMRNEHYRPLLDFLTNEFHESARIGSRVFLERNY